MLPVAWISSWLLLLAFCFVSSSAVCLLEGVGALAPPGGFIQFASPRLYIPSNSSVFEVSVLRVGGYRGQVFANITSQSSANATATDSRGAFDGNLSWTLVWEDSDMSPKVINVQNLVHNATGTVRLVIQGTEPLESKGQQIQTIYLPRVDPAPTAKLYFSTVTGVVLTWRGESDMSAECLIYATAAEGVSAGVSVGVELIPCLPPLRQADEGVDFDFFPRRLGPIVWAPWEVGTRCLVRKLQYLPNEAHGDLDAYGVLVWSDADEEKIESICLRSSSLTFQADPFAENIYPGVEPQAMQAYTSSNDLVIAVTDLGVVPKRSTCKKGSECFLDFPWTRLDPTDLIFSSFRYCPAICADMTNITPIVEAANLPFHLPRTFVDNFNSLIPVVLCLCRANSSKAAPRFMGTLVVEGPSSSNTARCHKGAPRCRILLSTVSTSIDSAVGRSIRILSDVGCRGLKGTPEAFLSGAKALINIADSSSTTSVYELENPQAMMEADPGLFKICWCLKSELTNCTFVEDYNTLVGDFVYAGPYSVGDHQATIGEKWVLYPVSGLGVTERDIVRVMIECGRDDGSPFLIANCANDSLTYDFGVVDRARIKAGTYSLCWCQPSTEFNNSASCSNVEDFVARFGKVTFSCPTGYINYQLQGDCIACLPWETSNSYEQDCKPESMKLALLVLSLAWGTLAMFTVFDQVEVMRMRSENLKRWFPFRFCLQGRSISIEDISPEDGETYVTTHGPHYLRRVCGSFSVSFRGTGHVLLDGEDGSSVQFRVVTVGSHRLRLSRADGCPLLRLDASMGVLVMRPLQALAQTAFLGILPCLTIFGILAVGGWIVRLSFFSNAVQSSWLLPASFIYDVISGLLLRCAWRLLRTPTPLQRRLKLYDKRLSTLRPTPIACDPGPSRAVTAFQLFDMHEFFQAFIRDRTMYYIDTHISKPLTVAHGLSYAERAGPNMVQWFVSHFWGTQFRNFCEAIARHAITTVDAIAMTSIPTNKSTDLGRPVTFLHAADESWKNSCYWICAFSNNQYKLDEELGHGDHKKSSFFLALHSGVCKGTCMILDECALPLTRSWCLFEVLQTIQLKKHQANFRGLLFCTSTGVLNYGAASVRVSLNIGARVAVMKLEEADATSLDDKNMINSLVLSEMGSFETINAELKGYIHSALNVCREHVAAGFDKIGQELRKGSRESTNSQCAARCDAPTHDV